EAWSQWLRPSYLLLGHGVVTSDQLFGTQRPKRGRLGPTRRHPPATPRRERTSDRRLLEIRRGTFDGAQRLTSILNPGSGIQQSDGVGMTGIREQLDCR